jgi:transcriptional regulator with XRE-family HTH domain
MGRKARQKPKRLAEKLVQIRTALGHTQSEMIKRLGVEDSVTQNTFTYYESGSREPSLITLLAYSRIAGVHMEALVDDALDLPDKLPGTAEHEAIRRQYTSRRKAKR